nr:response regulator [Desulfobulbaceae bacterium]
MPTFSTDMKILLVEDTKSMRRIEIKILKSIGLENIIEAEDGVVAVEILEERDDIDLIISDWNMPNMGGYELLVWVRKSATYGHVPFIMATAQADKAQANKAKEAGVSGFIPKPFSTEEIEETIEQTCGTYAGSSEEAVLGPIVASSGKALLRVAHIQITDHIILGILKDQIARGEVTPKHFELETNCMNGWNPVELALEKGHVDAAFILAPIAQDLFKHETPIKLTLLAHRGGSMFVSNTRGSYNTPSTSFFKQKSFLIPHKLSIHHMLTHMFFDKLGLKASLEKGADVDINLEVVAPINMSKFLKEDENIGGFMVAEPIGSESVNAGIATSKFLSNELWSDHPCCVVAMRDDFTSRFSDATYEFVDLLIKAGKFVGSNPELSAKIAVKFLDPKGELELKEPILHKVLTDPLGIKTDNLFPVLQDFENTQRYMFENMGVGSIIDLNKFIDTKYAEAACPNLQPSPGKLNTHIRIISEIMSRTEQPPLS